jgi:hypothetical protein
MTTMRPCPSPSVIIDQRKWRDDHGTVKRGNSDISSAVLVSLSSSDPGSNRSRDGLIPSNQTEASFAIAGVDDSQLEATDATTPHPLGYVSGSELDITI